MHVYASYSAEGIASWLRQYKYYSYSQILEAFWIITVLSSTVVATYVANYNTKTAIS